MAAASGAAVRVIGPTGDYLGKQGLTYNTGISTETVGARHVCLTSLTIPPGGRAKVHYHEGIETVAYVIDGELVSGTANRSSTRRASRPGSTCTSRRTCPTPRRTGASGPAWRWWRTREATTRRASCCCPNSTRGWPPPANRPGVPA